MKDRNGPIITVGNLCFNTGKYVLKSLDSVLAQTYKNFELIIVDDASSDNSASLIEDWIIQNSVQCTFIKHEKNKGICKSINEILDIAKGTYISLIGDDLWEIDFLESCYAAYTLPESENVSLVFTQNKILHVNEDRLEDGINPIKLCREKNYPRTNELFRKIHNDLYFLSNPYLTDVLFWFNPISAISTCMRIEAIQKIGGYNENIFFEDYDMWFKLSKETSFVYINNPKATYIRHDANFSDKRKYDIFLGELFLLLDNIKQIQFIETRKYLIKRLIFKYFKLFFYIKGNDKKNQAKRLLSISYRILKGSIYLLIRIFAQAQIKQYNKKDNHY